MNTNIVLVGFMGTGKTTVGLLLAEQLGWSFVDTDKVIVKRSGMSIPQIFEQQGEKAFRDLETAVVKDMVKGSGQIISTGGGAVLRPENREQMLAGGFVVALKADAETIISRVKEDKNRPLLAGDAEARVRALLLERAEAYDFAHLTLQTDQLSAEAAAALIAEAWKRKKQQA
ncbi:shikimate kinase [Paenibacillus turpanensis]|uniref:shikimate kinase n=1 Tax=Paenibacillus turpanensis TaxID=2689078 RepID=UPI001409B015|nr:shikimate kinase [Paenibacillus turpanensis]